MQGIFITGIDTGVGKTHVTCLLARYLRRNGWSVGLYKPACSGADQAQLTWPDLEQLSRALDGQYPREWICPQAFLAPLAPPEAAAQEGRTVDAGLLRTGIDVWRGQVDILLVEGVGGWMCPLTETETIADLARDLGFPVLVVAANRLGMISHTLLTLQSITFSELRICGAVVNPVSAGDDGTNQSNPRVLRKLTDIPIFGPLSWKQRPTEMAESAADELIWKELVSAGLTTGMFQVRPTAGRS